MALINFQQREIAVKIVYYGPAFSGKTTNVRKLHELIPNRLVGNLTSLDTEDERTLFFDYFPVKAGAIGKYKLKLQIYSVPGQVHYRATRRIVLKDADGVVFVADSQSQEMEHNIASLRDMEDNLKTYGVNLDEFPMVLQYNKRDVAGAISVDQLDRRLNSRGSPYCEAVATDGRGVLEAFNGIVELVTKRLRTELSRSEGGQPMDPALLKQSSSVEMDAAQSVRDMAARVAALGEHGEADLTDMLARLGMDTQAFTNQSTVSQVTSTEARPNVANKPVNIPDLTLKRLEELPDGSIRAEFRGPSQEVRLRLVFRREQLAGLIPPAPTPDGQGGIGVPPWLLIIVFVWLAVITVFALLRG